MEREEVEKRLLETLQMIEGEWKGSQGWAEEPWAQLEAVLASTAEQRAAAGQGLTPKAALTERVEGALRRADAPAAEEANTARAEPLEAGLRNVESGASSGAQDDTEEMRPAAQPLLTATVARVTAEWEKAAPSGNDTVSGTEAGAGATLERVVAGLFGGVLSNAAVPVSAGKAAPQEATAGAARSILEKIASPVSVLGMGVTGLVTGLAKLFGGGREEEPAPLTTYLKPARLQISGGVSGERGEELSLVDYSQDGLPRAVTRGGQVYSPQITVQVQAMDSRSFLDHSEEIAAAVRRAMLDSHALNDFVAEL